MNAPARQRRRQRVQAASLAILLLASGLEAVTLASGASIARDFLLVLIALTMLVVAVVG